jgi:hypothetical protein
MKNYLLFFLLALAACHTDTSAQCSNDCKSCTDKMNTNTTNSMYITTTKAEKQMTCKLTSPQLRKRKEEVISKLKALVLQKKELSNGYAYRFHGTDEILDSLTAFIKSERLCCDFFNFSLQISNQSVVWLEITGAKGTKEFIKTELEM